MIVNTTPGSDTAVDRETCRMCEEGVAHLGMVHRTVEHGRHGSHVEVEVLLPTWSCETCDMSYLADGAEELQHDAICDRLGRLRPSEIVEMRRAAGMNQIDFAVELEMASSSLKRWEAGTVIQDRRNDRLLRGYRAAALSRRRPVFRHEPTVANRLRSGRFRLNPFESNGRPSPIASRPQPAYA